MIVVVDVGTHNGDEVRLLASLNRESQQEKVRVFLRLLRATRSLKDARDYLRRIESAQEHLQGHDFAFAMIEPVPWRRFMDRIRRLPRYMYLQGVTSGRPSGPVTLHLSEGHLGHSIYPEKPGLSGKDEVVWNFNFDALWNSVQDLLNLDEATLVILRINAEGVESDIIESTLTRLSPKPNLIMGSIGDVRKVFGEAEYERTHNLMATHDVPFIYFTSSPRTWAPALESLVAIEASRSSTPYAGEQAPESFT